MDLRLLKLLEEQIDKVDHMQNEQRWGPNYDIWENTTKNIVHQLFGPEYSKLYENQKPRTFSMINQSFNQQQYIKELNDKKSFLESAIQEFKRLETDSVLSVGRSVGLSDYDLHQSIKEVVGTKFEDGHYAESVEAAFKEVIKRVKDFVNLKTSGSFDGDKAMNRAFGFETQEPLIKFNFLISEEEKNEQRGIMYLFKGIVGIRNRKAHENITLNDPYRALEYLSLASLLMRLLDEYENHLANKKL